MDRITISWSGIYYDQPISNPIFKDYYFLVEFKEYPLNTKFAIATL